MLQPKRTKFRKQHKGRNRGLAQSGNEVSFGEYGLKATTRGRITARQIEAARRAINRHVKRGGKMWIRIFPDVPVTNKPAVLARMSLSCSFSAAASSANVLVCVCPFVPMRPKRTVTVQPSAWTSQYLLDLPSTNSKRRMSSPSRKSGDCAGFGRANRRALHQNARLAKRRKSAPLAKHEFSGLQRLFLAWSHV